MKHVRDMGHITKSDYGVVLEKRVSLQMILRPVHAFISRAPFVNAASVLRIVCVVDFQESLIVGGVKLSHLKGESPLSGHGILELAGVMLRFHYFSRLLLVPGLTVRGFSSN